MTFYSESHKLTDRGVAGLLKSPCLGLNETAV